MLPQEILMILGVLRRILVHSEAYRSTQSFLRRGFSSKLSLLGELLEHWKPSPSARVYYLCLYIGVGIKLEVCRGLQSKSGHFCKKKQHFSSTLRGTASLIFFFAMVYNNKF